MRKFLTIISFSILACTAQANIANPPIPQTVIKEDPSGVLAETSDESQQSPIGTIVTVTRETVNLRNQSHASTGTFVQQGKVLTVDCGPDGYCEILEGEHDGLYIWRGCTSDPASYGCEAK
jgi:hypothetical protein